mmetsp:Transcript_5649/g.5806  ORF Transcript_5649/g.5806 Transcript_5649/m.5806 type:complete len:594 (-) Transcript_5649:49-1830(-)
MLANRHAAVIPQLLRSFRVKGQMKQVISPASTFMNYSSSSYRSSDEKLDVKIDINASEPTLNDKVPPVEEKSSSEIADSVKKSGINWDYDIIINGGGITGVTFAAKILQKTSNKLKIGIVDGRPPPTLASILDKKQPDIRVYALNPTSIKILKGLDAWPYIEQRTQPYQNMQVWESGGPGVVRFSASELNESELGRIVEDCTIQAALYETLKDKKHEVDFLFDSTVTALHVGRIDANTAGPAEVTLSSSSSSADSRTVTARLVVGADGGNSSIRRLGGFGSWGWGYGQEAVVCTVTVLPSDRPEVTAWQRYLLSGSPLALLPLWDNHSSVVWSTSVAEARRLCALTDESFLAELNSALQTPSQVDRWTPLKTSQKEESIPDDFPSFSPLFGGLLKPLQKIARGLSKPLSRIEYEVKALADTAMSASLLQNPFRAPPRVLGVVSKRVTFPLQFQQAKVYALPRLALIGDAAHSIHPQAGQGLNLGFQDADTLSELVLTGLKTGQDIGSIQLLKEYENKRYYSNLSMLSIVDTLNTVFSIGKTDPSVYLGGQKGDQTSAETAALFLRSVGMLGINSLGPIKGRIAQVAMGMNKKN